MLSPRSGGGGTAHHSTSAKKKRQQSKSPRAAASSYQRLDAVGSSPGDGRDEPSAETRLLPNESLLDQELEEEESLLDQEARDEEDTPRRGDGPAAAPPPPPPPPQPQPPSRPDNARGASSSSSSSHPDGVQTATPSQSSSNERRALVSLLVEMRALERGAERQRREHAAERTELTDLASRRAERIARLEEAERTLRTRNEMLTTRLGTTLARLDRFATGCWRFPSNSVKKMSEALHVQVREWERAYGVNARTAEEDAEGGAMEAATMEKMQKVHLEVRRLREENARLKKQMRRGGARGQGKERATVADDGKSVGSGMDAGSGIDGSDDVSHLSGVTQMTQATVSTAKLMDVVSGFLDEHDARQQKQQQQQGPLRDRRRQRENRQRVSVNTAANSYSSCPESRSGGPQPSVESVRSPRSILKKQMKYNDRAGEPRARSDPERHPRRPSAATQPSQEWQAQEEQRQEQPQCRHDRQRPKTTAAPRTKQPSRPPKSPTRIVGDRTKARGGDAPSSATPSGADAGFADFDGDFDGAGLKFADFGAAYENGMWVTTWEQSEV